MKRTLTKSVELNVPLAVIEKQIMSDKSVAYNVIATIDGHLVRFACQTAGHASNLASSINNTSWAEVAIRSAA